MAPKINSKNKTLKLQNETPEKFDAPMKSLINSSWYNTIERLRESEMHLIKTISFIVNPFGIFPTSTQPKLLEQMNNTELDFGISISTEGRFYFNDQLIPTISTNSKHGRLFKLLLTNDDNYVSDNQIIEELEICDFRGVGFIRRDMKSSLRKFGFKVNLYRERKKGYRLLDISRPTS